MRGTGQTSEPCSSAHPQGSWRLGSSAHNCQGSAEAGACFMKADSKFQLVWHCTVKRKACNSYFYTDKREKHQTGRTKKSQCKYKVRESHILEKKLQYQFSKCLKFPIPRRLATNELQSCAIKHNIILCLDLLTCQVSSCPTFRLSFIQWVLYTACIF